MANPLKMLKLKPTGFQYILETPVKAPPRKVWATLVDVKSWFQFDPTAKQTLELFPGGRWMVETTSGNQMLNAIITHIEPEKLLRMSGPMGLTHLPCTNVFIFELQPKKDGKETLLRVGHRAFGFMDKDVKKRYSGGIGEMLKLLKAHAEKS